MFITNTDAPYIRIAFFLGNITIMCEGALYTWKYGNMIFNLNDYNCNQHYYKILPHYNSWLIVKDIKKLLKLKKNCLKSENSGKCLKGLIHNTHRSSKKMTVTTEHLFVLLKKEF